METHAYEITETAGPDVAGQRNPGAGETIRLTAGQAEHAVRLGHIKLKVVEEPKPPKRSRRRKTSDGWN